MSDRPPVASDVPDRSHDYDHPWPWQVEENLAALQAGGKTYREMADEMGCTSYTIWNWLGKHGLREDE